MLTIHVSRYGIVPKIMQIAAGILKKWAFTGVGCLCQWKTKF